jgi:hypothetical protein
MIATLLILHVQGHEGQTKIDQCCQHRDVIVIWSAGDIIAW